MTLGPSAFGGVVAAQVGNGPARAMVDISSSDYRLASVAHRWATPDIYEYDVSLSIRNASGTFVPLNPQALIKLAQKITSPQTEATFNGLQHGTYEASVVAWGNASGTAASDEALTRDATAAIDLTVSDTADATMSLTFNAVPFDATATVTLENPASDGTFVTTGPATITAQ